MAGYLRVSIGQHSDAGAKPSNQDFHGARVPEGAELESKGVAMALADGISSSDVAHIASETAVKSFLQDYYCTSAAWSVKKSADRVINATNAWLTSHTNNSWARYDKDRGYVCTFTGLIIKSARAYLLHVGDARAYRVQGRTLEQLTRDHRHWTSPGKSYLGRALGVNDQLEIDYHSLSVVPGDIFVLVTDGIHETLTPGAIAAVIADNPDDLDEAARIIVGAAYEQGSDDNLTVQILRIDETPQPKLYELQQHVTELPFPPTLNARSQIDGFEIVRELHMSSRSYVYLALDTATGRPAVLKVPATDVREDPVALEQFLAEEWVARRIDSPYVLRAYDRAHAQNYLYVATEYIEGQTLDQWLRDNPDAPFSKVRALVEQIGKGLRAFHRQDMLHQDLRPANIMIDSLGTAKLIDFGAVQVAGVSEGIGSENAPMLGTQQYSAPEYFLGECGSARSDIFSLGVVAYQMLAGRLPYGPEASQVKNRAGLNRLRYDPVYHYNRSCPTWIDGALRKALHPKPDRRYEDVSEFIHDLYHPRREFVNAVRPPLLERNPEAFWKGVSGLLAVLLIVQLILSYG
ncbi:bifunctional protein-serine/threonine kinase/phosphatase [Hydrocarboniclastica marina]|uniref:Bifunctional protein-serine/threonine kinase/phosphatase n=1 Tax=Hydrocarboniclastica marina TaxID=2259620 RepID=A0A4P7XEZ6_9ALTE|nr:bifunctional protein-serine/threonine kinase/phosphatase [Hydrocarboniclastica marina]QCF25456.1 bifunctional protein-serine/threonine kinase/phosphatase [Hydrocarboniclastica marina]